ncbi:MAG: precorrin-3B C(17)-methyltransferase [Caldimicrobium sp.]|nr:precorrin-3B C(17)-methyltransferase [Caldimicrobium sp.]MDW8182099.1 precorrin-3B C(17)-methyltransferase [Caldimicrobium sp.]
MEKSKESFFVYLSENAQKIGRAIEGYLGKLNYIPYGSNLSERLRDIWKEGNIIIFVMALGIVARLCKDFIKEKGRDPGVIVIDEEGKHVIPYLGGHYAETNRIAKDLAIILEANPVITTASDIKNIPALDLWIKREGYVVKNKELLAKVMSRLNRERQLSVYIEGHRLVNLPNFLKVTSEKEQADILISPFRDSSSKRLILIPKRIWIGIGFHNWLKQEDLEERILKALEVFNLEISSVKGVATIDKKASFEPLHNLALKWGWQIKSFSKDELSRVTDVTTSLRVRQAVGTGSVSEASARLASKGDLLIPKRVYKDFTIAVAAESSTKKGKLYMVGIGPGDTKYLTIKALRVLSSVEAVVGYRTYIRLIEDLIKGKEVHIFSMTEEVKRVKKAIELALSGKDTALVSGGDPGIYGLSGLLLEILEKNKLDLEVEIIPGISALNAVNALLGAPLVNDFAVISLSDRLTPLSVIEKRLLKLAEMDIPIVIYNPKSKTRVNPLEMALEILRKKRPLNSLCAIVNSATREDEEIIISNLQDFPVEKVSMNSLVIIGGDKTRTLGKYIVTLRGYQNKYAGQYEFSSINE